MQRHEPVDIAPESAEAYEVATGRADAGLVVLCDHATNALPPEYGTLGLPPDQLKRHIAYDIGAAAVARHIGEAMGCPVVSSRYSRLLIDPNRGHDDPTLIMRLSDGAIVPGNRHLDDAERERRLTRFYWPYHHTVARVITAAEASGKPLAVLSIHSFPESWKGTPRPWHVGVLWDRDPRLARPLLDAFFASGDLIVGDNEPYTGRLVGDTLWQHATSRNLPNAIIEVRQDLIRDAAGQAAWGARIVTILRSILPHLATSTCDQVQDQL
jgi:predicted N-formylglutamate amidohydrolase